MFKKILRITLYTVIVIFAIIGFGLTASYLAIKLHWTDDPGAVDYNDRFYGELAAKNKNDAKADSIYFSMQDGKRAHDYLRIIVISKFYPYNASLILNALGTADDADLANRMLTPIELVLKDNSDFQKLSREIKKLLDGNIKRDTSYTAFDWMNFPEWRDLREAIAKDKHLIDSAAGLAGVESRIVVCCLLGEQIRLYNSKREVYKSYLSPLKVLVTQSTFSLGITGMKDFTAIAIEKNLKDSQSVFYPGRQYARLLDFSTEEPDSERYHRLTQNKNHFYQYLYTALYLKQVEIQWRRSGYPINERPEILATLYNVGFPFSIPKKDPKVGGSRIKIHEKNYTFGGIAFDFYYSGELLREFPFTKKKFYDPEKGRQF